MSEKQEGLGQYGVEVHPDDSMFGDVRDYVSGVVGAVRERVEGFDIDWWGKSPSQAGGVGDVWVYQHVVAYSLGDLREGYKWDTENGKSPRQGSPSAEVQFKTGIYVVGEPTDEIERRLRDVEPYRLVTAFDTREYEGYMTGFGFQERKTYTQRERVSAREAEQKGYGLGVPWFEVEAYDEDGEFAGYADGFLDPFTTETGVESFDIGEDPPEQEVWRVRDNLNTSRSVPSWEVGPDPNTPASQRSRAISGKSVYIGPYEIGTVTQRGTTWLRREYSGSGQYTDKATITGQSGIPPQALQSGTKLYKFRETENAIYLSTTEPPTGFRPVEPEDVSPEGVGRRQGSEEVTEILLDDDEPTTVTVETDEQVTRLLGLYDAPVVREIGSERRLVP